MTITSKYFTELEFQRCTPSCSLQDMDQQLMNLLDAIRQEAGIPLVLNSAYRSVAHEKDKGRSGVGDHPNRQGVDIRCYDSANRFKILRAGLKLGVKRFGLANSFVHIGTTEHLPQEVAWTYK